MDLLYRLSRLEPRTADFGPNDVQNLYDATLRVSPTLHQNDELGVRIVNKYV